MELFLKRSVVLLAWLATASGAADENAERDKAIVIFEDSVEAILKRKCQRCHNPKKLAGGLNLTTAAGMLRGSESGRVIRSGKPDESLLFELVEADEMPPADEKLRLSHAEKELIKGWIASGARFRDSAASQPEVIQHDIVPLMHLRCVACHGGRRREADLDLRTKESMLKGGKSGPGVVSGKPNDSLIVKRIKLGEMPPRRKLVSVSVKTMEANELDLLTKWIELGLPESNQHRDAHTDGPAQLASDSDRAFWSFQSPISVAVPTVKYRNRVRNSIDAFVIRKLESVGLSLSPEADRTTLLRRIYFQLLGLPPSPDEIDLFVNDPDPMAYEKLVERLLASPQYGERWARHWLDVAGYADSEGAQNEDRIRPHMYRYRDYVIRAFNADKPYTRFLMEQIAGDELADFENADFIDQTLYDNLVATGFLRTAPDRTFANITNFVPDRLEVIADEIQILGSSVLGLSLHCARCHSHKFDPISQRDYYRLSAVLKDAYDEHDWLKSQGPRTLPQVTTYERRQFQQSEESFKEEVRCLDNQLTQYTDAARHKQIENRLAALPDEIRDQVAAALATSESNSTAEQKALLEKHDKLVTISTDELKKLDPAFQTVAAEIENQKNLLESQRIPEPRIRALWSRGEPSPTYVLKRGNYLTPGRLVGPGVPSVLTDGKTRLQIMSPWPGAKQTGRRLALARWLTAEDHPLTSRVMVNRVWKHHFGNGLVKTLGNFGKAGARPSHPELLDWLALEFVRCGWNVKALHRLLVTSSTYRQSSQVTDAHLKRDPDGTLLSRMPLKRMEAEVLRDTLVSISGRLNNTRFGPADPVDVRGDGLIISKGSASGWRRSIYILQRRTQIPSLLENFDFPQMGPNCLQRGSSIVAPQALHLMNNKVIYELAMHFAARVQKEFGNDRANQVEGVFRLALSRSPSDEERSVGVETLARLAEKWSLAHTAEEDEPNASQMALLNYCHAVMNSAAFLYID